MEQIFQINHKHCFIPKCFNKNTDTARYGPPKAIFQRHQPTVNSVRFNDPYDSINTRDNTNDPTPLVHATGEYLPEEPEVEE